MKVLKLGALGVMAIGLVGCAAEKQIDYSGLTSAVQKVEGDAFGQCMAEAHRATVELDMAKENLAALQAGSNSSDDLAKGQKAVAAAAAHRAKAEKGCEDVTLPMRKRIAALEVGHREMDARVTKLETVREIVRGVTFTVGSAKLTKQAMTVLDVVANRLERSPRHVEVGGHASNTGKADANMKLSERRAEAVKMYLVKMGVDASLITTKGYGITMPVADNSTKAGQRANQRIELTYTTK